MGEVTVVSGPPGAGKSTVAEELARLLDPSALVTGDDFFAFLRTGAVAPWLPAAHEQNAAVVDAAAAATGRLAARSEVVYDGVLGPWFLDGFLRSTGVGHLHYAVLLPPLATCLRRVGSRTGHGFTDRDAAESMWREFAASGVPTRHLLGDGNEPPEELARVIVQRTADGSLRVPSR